MSRTIHFTKMHGAGNDYVYVDCFEQDVPADIPALARAMSDRHAGIGADGLILIEPAETVRGNPVPRTLEMSAALGGLEPADARMRMWNADGSPAEMCGNGIRCVAKYLYEHGIARRRELRIQTANGVRTLELKVTGGQVEQVRVNMGRPVLQSEEIPTTLPGDPPVDAPLRLDFSKRGESELHCPNSAIRIAPPPELAEAGNVINVTCVSMGNPHCVTFVEELSDAWVLGVGPAIEVHPAFPSRVNAEFVEVLSPAEIVMRVWERGTGETQACGSGASAAAVAGVLTGRTERRIDCRLPGGILRLEWDESGDVYLTGPAVEVFSGDWPRARIMHQCPHDVAKPGRRRGLLRASE